MVHKSYSSGFGSFPNKINNEKYKCKGEKMINDERIQEWIDKCPEHDNEILHSDDNGIVMVIRFNNEKEEEWYHTK